MAANKWAYYLDMASLSAFQYCPYRYEQEQKYGNRKMTDAQLRQQMGAEHDPQRALLWKKEWERRHSERMDQSATSVSAEAVRKVNRAILIAAILLTAGVIGLLFVSSAFASDTTWLVVITTFVLVFICVFGICHFLWQRKQRNIVIYRKSVKKKPLVDDESLCYGAPNLIERTPRGELIVTLQLPTDIERNRKRPYEGDILQLGGYFMLVKHCYQEPIRTGRIEYHNRTFEIHDTEVLGEHVTHTIRRLRLFQKSGKLPNIPIVKDKCEACVFYQTVCEKGVSV